MHKISYRVYTATLTLLATVYAMWTVSYMYSMCTKFSYPYAHSHSNAHHNNGYYAFSYIIHMLPLNCIKETTVFIAILEEHPTP